MSAGFSLVRMCRGACDLISDHFARQGPHSTTRNSSRCGFGDLSSRRQGSNGIWSWEFDWLSMGLFDSPSRSYLYHEIMQVFSIQQSDSGPSPRCKPTRVFPRSCARFGLRPCFARLLLTSFIYRGAAVYHHVHPRPSLHCPTQPNAALNAGKSTRKTR